MNRFKTSSQVLLEMEIMRLRKQIKDDEASISEGVQNFPSFLVASAVNAGKSLFTGQNGTKKNEDDIQMSEESVPFNLKSILKDAAQQATMMAADELLNHLFKPKTPAVNKRDANSSDHSVDSDHQA